MYWRTMPTSLPLNHGVPELRMTVTSTTIILTSPMTETRRARRAKREGVEDPTNDTLPRAKVRTFLEPRVRQPRAPYIRSQHHNIGSKKGIGFELVDGRNTVFREKAFGVEWSGTVALAGADSSVRSLRTRLRERALAGEHTRLGTRSKSASFHVINEIRTNDINYVYPGQASP